VVAEATASEIEVVEITPFTLETRLEPEVVRVFPVISDVVAIDPATLVVRTLPEVVAETGTDRLVKVALVPTRLVVVALVADKLVEVVLVATTVAKLAVPVAVMLVPVALPKSKLVMEARAAERKLVRKLPEFTMFSEVVVPVRLMAFSWLMEVVETTPLTVDCMVLEAPAV
jgi:hypothetical protein